MTTPTQKIAGAIKASMAALLAVENHDTPTALRKFGEAARLLDQVIDDDHVSESEREAALEQMTTVVGLFGQCADEMAARA